MRGYLKPWHPTLRRKVETMVSSHLQPHRLRSVLSPSTLRPYSYPLFRISSPQESAQGLSGGEQGFVGDE